ncbi:MAG: cyclic nucleotide-binding domain-containing protein [Anaerolineae bacterium]|nr:cyclic nucleotide-binding domain-containing protein [Anaerolineae bacterium]
MNIAEIIQQLGRIPLFSEIDPHDLKPHSPYHDLVQWVHEEEYQPGDLLFAQGEPSTRLYYLVEGGVHLTQVSPDETMLHLGDLGPGDSAGETGLLLGDYHDATADVLLHTRVLSLEREEFAQFLADKPEFEQLLNVSAAVKARRALPTYDWLRVGELVIFAENRHWSNLVRRIGPPFILLLIAVVVSYPLLQGGGGVGLALGVLLVLVASMLGLFVLWQFANWQDDLVVLTTERIVHEERVWPIHKSFEEGSLENIEDIHTLQSGIVANALDYGDLTLQTAGEKVEIDLTQVGHPAKLREQIFREITRNRARSVMSVRGTVREKLAERLNPELASPPERTIPATSATGPSIKLFWGVIADYFFPPSWVESEDGSTIHWRRFWVPGFFKHLKVFIPAALWMVVGLSIFYFLFQFRDGRFDDLIYWLVFWLSGSAVLFAWLLWAIEDWANDYFEVTPGRIVIVYQKPLLFSRSRQEARLDNIQNISSESPGVLAGLLKYGHVVLETAGTQGQFELQWVRYPDKVRAEISKRQQVFRRRQSAAEAQRRQGELLRWFDIYDELKHPEKVHAETKRKFEQQEQNGGK